MQNEKNKRIQYLFLIFFQAQCFQQRLDNVSTTAVSFVFMISGVHVKITVLTATNDPEYMKVLRKNKKEEYRKKKKFLNTVRVNL